MLLYPESAWDLFEPLKVPSSQPPLGEGGRTIPFGRRSHENVTGHEETKESSSSAKLVLFLGFEIWFQSYRHGGRHLTAEELEVYRRTGDPPVDRLLVLYQEQHQQRIPPGEDLLALASTARPDATTPLEQSLAQHFLYHSSVPTWVDWAQIERGRRVFLAYCPAMSMALYYRSLVPGFSIPAMTRVLKATAYLAPPANRQQVRQRLMDTGAWLALCFAHQHALRPGHAGWKACWQVRVLHAKVRERLLAKIKMSANSNNRHDDNVFWNLERQGVPISEEDVAATLLAFALNPLVGVEILSLGVPLSVQEREDYMAIWRYIGWLLGVRVIDDDLCTRARDDRMPKTDHSTSTTSDARGRQQQKPPRALDPCGPGWPRCHPEQPNKIQRKERTLAHPQAMLDSFILHLMHPNSDSVAVAHHLLWQGRDDEERSPSALLTNRSPRRKMVNETTTSSSKPESPASLDRWFYYRSLQCRRFIGKPIADALQLPVHTRLWDRAAVWCFSTAVLVIMSAYTQLARPWSPMRGRILRWHERMFQQFVDTWTREHHESGSENQENKSNGANEEETGESTFDESNTMAKEYQVVTDDDKAVVRGCPFALVNAPKLDR